MIETFQKYSGSGLMLCWFIVAWLYLFVTEKEKDRRIMFVYVPPIVLLFFFNPLFYKIFGGVSDEAIYFRFLWLLPISLVLAYSVIKICMQLKGMQRKTFAVIAIFLVMVSGRLVYLNPLFSRAENPYHVPQEVVHICDAIEVEGREVMALFPDEFLLYVRQYSPMVCIPYGREFIGGDYNELGLLMREDVIDVERMVSLVERYTCHYIIFHEEKVLKGDLEEYGYVLFDVIDGYKIYLDTKLYLGL